jgi:hypothetical protein
VQQSSGRRSKAYAGSYCSHHFMMIAREGVCRAMLTKAMQVDEPVRRVLQ